MDEALHIMPLDDLREHQASPDCWCRPEPVPEEPLILIHRSLDGREDYETGRLKPH